jgi:hypothetical protein
MRLEALSLTSLHRAWRHSAYAAWRVVWVGVRHPQEAKVVIQDVQRVLGILNGWEEYIDMSTCP